MPAPGWPAWISCAVARPGRFRLVVPSHGPVHAGLQGMEQTRDWLQWLTALMQTSAAQGWT